MMQKIPDQEPTSWTLDVSPDRSRHYQQVLRQAIRLLSLPAPIETCLDELTERSEVVAGLRRVEKLFEPIVGDEVLTDTADELLQQLASTMLLVLGHLQIETRSEPGRRIIWGQQREAVDRKLKRFEGESDG